MKTAELELITNYFTVKHCYDYWNYLEHQKTS